MDEKHTLRQQIRALKRAMTEAEKQQRSQSVMQSLLADDAFARAQVVLLYWSMSDEVQTHALVESLYQQKTVLLPCVDGDDLRLRQYTGPQCLVAGQQFGIGEPTGPEWTNLEAVEVIVVPGVAFDAQGNRMGRGRGFYDRLLKSTPNAVKIGVAYSFQMVDHVPTEEHDVPMNRVIHDGLRCAPVSQPQNQ